MKKFIKQDAPVVTVVAIVTGGNSGLGLAFAKGLVKSGAKVAIWGRNVEKNDNAVSILRELDGDVAAFSCDVTDAQQTITAFESTLAHFGKVDICFANAGGSGKQGLFIKTSSDDWNAVIDLNLNSVVNTYKPVRLMRLKEAAPEYMEGLEKLEKENGFTKALLQSALEKSGQAIEKLLEKGLKDGKIKGIKPYPMTFMGYLIAHESHHRGQIMVCLKQSGHPVSKKVQFGLWEWGVR